VRLVGFGTFQRRQSAGLAGTQPRTGEPLSIAATKQPKFRAGKVLKDAAQLTIAESPRVHDESAGRPHGGRWRFLAKLIHAAP